MITPITVQYLGDPNRVGGRDTIERELPATCFWDPSVKSAKTDPRVRELSADIECTLLLETQLTYPEPKRCFVVKDETTYIVVETIGVVDDLGLDGTMTLYLKEYKPR